MGTGSRATRSAGMTVENAALPPLIGPSSQRRPQIVPIFILFLDQLGFPCARAALHSFLLGNGRANVVVRFIIDEAMNLVLFCEAWNGVSPVFVNTAHEVVCHADVERPAPTACKDIEVVGHRHILICHPGQRAERADPGPMYHRARFSRRDGSRLSLRSAGMTVGASGLGILTSCATPAGA